MAKKLSSRPLTPDEEAMYGDHLASVRYQGIEPTQAQLNEQYKQVLENEVRILIGLNPELAKLSTEVLTEFVEASLYGGTISLTPSGGGFRRNTGDSLDEEDETVAGSGGVRIYRYVWDARILIVTYVSGEIVAILDVVEEEYRIFISEANQSMLAKTWEFTKNSIQLMPPYE